jgi:hypothetical protein
MSDFIPKIAEDTIMQLVVRDYPAEVTDRVFSMLAEYGTKPHHVERTRVRAAALKLANGDLLELQRQLAVANSDYRDIIGAAEYPSQMKLGFVSMERLAPEKLQELREIDWRDYSGWLGRR